MDVQLILVCLFILPPCPAALAKKCAFNATFIKREKELFNRTNYETVCLNQETDYGRELTTCNGRILNPKCVCAYEMYAYDISDICKKTAPRENGSLDHVKVEFCMKYSYTRAGPCQNGGELVNPTELASDAKCRCKEFYSGDFCDTISKPIVCTESKPGSLLPDCAETFIAYPGNSSCSLTIGPRHFICDTQKTVKDGTLDCSSPYYNPASNMQGDNNEANGKSPLSGSPMLLVCLVVLLLTCRLDYGDVFSELNV